MELYSIEYFASALIIFLYFWLEHLANSAFLAPPQKLLWKYITYRFIILLLFCATFLMLIMLLTFIYSFPSIHFFERAGRSENDFTIAIGATVLIFFICCICWHYIFYCFPILMLILTRLTIRSKSISDFPKVVDYLYYTFAATGIGYAFVNLARTDEITDENRRFYLVVAVIIISLRFTKVTIDKSKKYLDETIFIRTFEGTIILRKGFKLYYFE